MLVTKEELKAKKAIEKWNKKVAKRNAEFHAATSQEKRVLIAKDVLKQLKATFKLIENKFGYKEMGRSPERFFPAPFVKLVECKRIATVDGHEKFDV